MAKGILTIKASINTGFNKKMGARPLQRVIDKEIKRPLSKELLFGKLKTGGTLTIDIVDNEVSLNVLEESIVENA